nr:magnesium transporter CorA family protein [Schlegelella koreensis]
MPASGYCWVAAVRGDLRAQLVDLQTALQRWTGAQLVDLHVSDLLNAQLPSTYDYTSWYDILVFRRLAAPAAGLAETGEPPLGRAAPTGIALQAVDTSPVGFALFDRLLLTVHPNDCVVRDFFANRLQNQMPATDVRSVARTPPSPADLMLRMVNFMVDSYLELRRVLTRQLDAQQQALFDPRGGIVSWQTLLASRNAMHLLEDTCEDQRSAISEWIDALDEWPPPTDPAASREREVLRVRSRDVLEHIERVLSHVRRLEASAETAVQMHFSAQSHRTNDIMRTLTVLTAIFLPLNLVTGFFGMNFEKLPLIHSPRGFWIAFVLLLAIGAAMSAYFWRKRYIGRTP